MKSKQTKSSLLLVLTALIWGMAFAAQSAGMDYVGPFTFNAIRLLIGAVAVLPCVTWQRAAVDKTMIKTAVIGGICCGIALAFSSLMQQIGIMYTTVGKAGFITSLYIVIVPILGMAAGKRVPSAVWISVIIALAGMYLLCLSEGISINKGDLYMIISAVGFSFHILIIDYFSPKTSGVMISCIQFLIAGIISGILMFLWEKPDMASILNAKVSILYAGIMSCGVAYTLQIVAQKDMNPAVASLILSLESVFALLAGWLLLKEVLSSRELLGCLLVFLAIILAQLPAKKSLINSASDRHP